MNGATHQCPAPSCPVQIPDDLVMCKLHWSLVPIDIRRRIYRGHLMDPTSHEYRVAVDEAIVSLQKRVRR